MPLASEESCSDFALVVLSGLKADEYNGCIAQVLQLNDPIPGRIPVFPFLKRRKILVKLENVSPADLQQALEDICLSLANDELGMTLKDLGAHRSFYEPDRSQPSIVMQGKMPLFGKFLDADGYANSRRQGLAADCTATAMFFRIAVRLYGLPALPHYFWFSDCETREEDELAACVPPSQKFVTMCSLRRLKDAARSFFSESRRFGLVVSHSEGITDLSHSRKAEPFDGHYLTVLQVGDKFRIVHSFGLRPPPTLFSLADWLTSLQPEWLSAAEMMQEWELWETACTSPNPAAAAKGATKFFKKPFVARADVSIASEIEGYDLRPEADMTFMCLSDLDPFRLIKVMQTMLAEMNDARQKVLGNESIGKPSS